MGTKFLELPLIRSILLRLEEELDSQLVYHSVGHTKSVIGEALLFAEKDCLAKRDVELLAIAAAYHDAGFLQSPSGEEHEKKSAAICREALLADSNYSPEEIATIEQTILDTESLKATTPLSPYLLDADFSNFGREDFFEKLALITRERGAEGGALYAETISLLESHSWLTPAARELRQAKKEENLELLRARTS